MIWVNKRIRHYLKPMFRLNDVLSGWILWAYFWLVRSLVRRYNTVVTTPYCLKILYLKYHYIWPSKAHNTYWSAYWILYVFLEWSLPKVEQMKSKPPLTDWWNSLTHLFFVQMTTTLINWSTTGCSNNKCSSENKNFRRYQHHIIC